MTITTFILVAALIVLIGTILETLNRANKRLNELEWRMDLRQAEIEGLRKEINQRSSAGQVTDKLVN